MEPRSQTWLVCLDCWCFFLPYRLQVSSSQNHLAQRRGPDGNYCQHLQFRGFNISSRFPAQFENLRTHVSLWEPLAKPRPPLERASSLYILLSSFIVHVGPDRYLSLPCRRLYECSTVFLSFQEKAFCHMEKEEKRSSKISLLRSLNSSLLFPWKMTSWELGMFSQVSHLVNSSLVPLFPTMYQLSALCSQTIDSHKSSI